MSTTKEEKTTVVDISSSSTETEKDVPSSSDELHRFGEYGLVGAVQADESHYDKRDDPLHPHHHGRHDSQNYYTSSNDDDSEVEADEDDVLGADGRIKFAERKLYGRDKEIAKLFDMYDNMMKGNKAAEEQQSSPQDSTKNNPDEPQRQQQEEEQEGRTPTCAFIAAYSGAGKSSLVKEFVKKLRRRQRRQQQQQQQQQAESSTATDSHNSHLLFLKAKYETMQSAAPFRAFKNLFENIDSSERDGLILMKEQILDVIGDDLFILARLFPGLCQKLGLGMHVGEDTASSVGSLSHSQSAITRSVSTSTKHRHNKLSKGRLQNTIQKFFRILCTKERPLILFVDDLQWADSQSLETIEVLLTDDSLQYLFFIGAYRSNEVDETHTLTKIIQSIGETNGTPVDVYEPDELSQEDVAEFIADSSRLDFTRTSKPSSTASRNIFSSTSLVN